MKKFCLFIVNFLLFLLAGNLVQAQESPGQDDPLSYRRWRLTLINPLSTNGIKAPDYTARYSINLLGGYHGGLDGAEFGLLYNYEKRYINGFQIAGLLNGTGGDLTGINLAGAVNYSKNNMNGLQYAGFLNYSGSEMSGIQFTGLLNYAGNTMAGIQIAGISNISRDNLEGLQFAGLFNASRGNTSGIQITPGVNAALANLEGLQVAGILNYAHADISGLQLSGVASISRKNMDGLVISSALNYTGQDANGILISSGFNISGNSGGMNIAGIGNFSKKMSGIQIAGLINAAGAADGVQIGLLNFAREFNGAPIGAISLYGNGRRNIDARFSDAGFSDYILTTGTPRIYNMVIFGHNAVLDRPVYRIGLGFGVERNIKDIFPRAGSETLFINQEFDILHHFEENWDRKTNLIFSYKYLFGKRFGNHFSVYAGPSLNIQVTRIPEAADYTWYSLWSPEWHGRKYRFWAGFSAGIRLFKQKSLPVIEKNWHISTAQ